MIYIDSRRCASGKTRDGLPTAIIDKPNIHNKGIELSTWALIKTRYELGDRVLVVLPSLLLLDDYEQEFTDYMLSEGVNIKNQLKVLSSKTTNNVQLELNNALFARTMIIIITQAAFLESEILSGQRTWQAHRSNELEDGVTEFTEGYHLIIDEAIEPYRELQYYHEKDCKVNFDWAENSTMCEAPDLAVEWKQILFSDNLRGNGITDGSEVIRAMSNKNWQSRMLEPDYKKFIGVVERAKRVSIIQELKPEIFSHWMSVWVAAANFEVTFMRYWMDAHNLAWEIRPKLEFVPHTTPVLITGNGDCDFKWSSYKQQNEPELIQQFADIATPIVGDEPVLVLRNSGENKIYQKIITVTDEQGNQRQVEQEHKVPHNCAGGNQWRHIKFVSLESALNPTPKLNEFLYSVYGISTKGNINGATRDLVHMARTVYTFYQTVMRSCLRENQPATVLCLDNRVILGLAEFFDNIELNEFVLSRKDVQPVGRPEKENKLSNTESKQARRLRLRFPDLAHMTNEELIVKWRNKELA